MTPEQFIADFITSFTEEIMRSEADPAPIVDKYYTPDIVQTVNGIPLDRAKLIAHVHPVRKNLLSYRIDVHEAMTDGARIAARFTIEAQMRKKPVTTEVYYFAEKAPDGRIRRTHQLTREL